MKIKKTIASILSKVCIWKTGMNPDEARDILMSFSEKPSGTCIANNTTDISYDLQVVIAAYNVENYITECLNSVLQLYDKGYKVLITVVDDGSLDSTGQIIDSFIDKINNPSFRVIHQKNKGFSGARNSALEHIQGEYVMLVDSDDFLPAEMDVKKLLETAKGYDILQGYMVTVDTDSKVIDHIKPTNAYGYACGKLYHHRLFNNLKFPEGYWYEDTPLTFILSGMNLKTAIIEEDIYCYRQNPEGITQVSRKKPKAIDSYWITELCLEEFPAFGIKYDQSAYECLMYQIITNRQRMYGLPVQVRKAVFILTCDLIDKYFQGIHSNIFPEMEKAFHKRQFERFEMMYKSGDLK